MKSLMLVIFSPDFPIQELGYETMETKLQIGGQALHAMWCSAAAPEWGGFLALTPAMGDPLQPLQNEALLVQQRFVLAVTHKTKDSPIGFLTAGSQRQ